MTLRSLKEMAAGYVREQILTGKLTPGTRIDPGEISEALGISRLPVREALIELAHESLIDAVPRRGAFVAALQPEDIIDHYRIFGVVAGLAASRAAYHLTDVELSQLRGVHDAFVAASDAQDRNQLNHEFHRIINHAGGSRQMSTVLRLLSRSLPVRYFDFAPQWAEVSATHHARILRALEDREAHDAQRTVEHHVSESGELAVEILQQMGYWNRAVPSELDEKLASNVADTAEAL